MNNIITVVIPFDLIETTPAEHQEKEDIIQESDATSSGDEMSDDTDPASLRDVSLGIYVDICIFAKPQWSHQPCHLKLAHW